ncbi:hypothetical protein JTB14_018773 [Gonioctena quinquepunctata]|nr:hypothetical protein JTB14_018773 [Gonioctena quinquepunctata]
MMAYAVSADSTADIAEKEQLSIGLRFNDDSKGKIREEFVGFVELRAQDASSIAEAIDNFLVNYNLPPEYCVGFGFGGCSAMTGKDGGVQAILRNKYSRALYFHCSSHKLNVVVNDANKVPEIRNTIAAIKDTINFFMESTVRRIVLPLYHECLVETLEKLCIEGNDATRKSAHQLHSAVTETLSIIAFITIAKYSFVLKPVVNALQAKSVDLIGVGEHITGILDVLKQDRKDADRITYELLKNAPITCYALGLDLAYDRVFVRSTWTIACFHEKYELSACYQDMYLGIRTLIGSPLGILASFAFHQCEQISLVILSIEGSSY